MTQPNIQMIEDDDKVAPVNKACDPTSLQLVANWNDAEERLTPA